MQAMLICSTQHSLSCVSHCVCAHTHAHSVCFLSGTSILLLFTLFLCVPQHDPLSFFPGQEELSPLSLSNQQPSNVHNRVLRLKPDLFVVGFGGSIPVFKDGQQFWLSKYQGAYLGIKQYNTMQYNTIQSTYKCICNARDRR